MLLWSHFSEGLSSFLFLLLFGSLIFYAQTTKLNCFRFASSFRLPCMQIKRIMSIQFWLWFYLEKNAFYVFWCLTHIGLFEHLNDDSAPNVFEYGLHITEQNMPNRNILRNESSSFTFFRSFEMHIFIGIVRCSMTQSEWFLFNQYRKAIACD